MVAEFTIGRHRVGLAHPTYFVADIGANHDGDLSRARDLIFEAAEAGAAAAKFQNFRPETIVSGPGFDALGSKLSHQASWNQGVVEVYRAASLPTEWTVELHGACDEAGIDYFTAPYDLELVDLLSPHVCAWKVGSGDITWHSAIERMAKDGKPILIATGASTLDEVRQAVGVAAGHSEEIVILQCNTNYSNSLDNFNFIELNVLKTYGREFPAAVLGLSDHTPGHATVLGAVALGARVVEKHFTDDRSREGPDHPFSMEPSGWRDMVDRTRELEASLGGEEKRVMQNELETVVVQRRAVRARGPIRQGSRITAEDLTVLRPCPADALPPYRFDEVVGLVACRDIEAGECVRPTDLA
jgi:N-acetylneuraminate synthase